MPVRSQLIRQSSALLAALWASVAHGQVDNLSPTIPTAVAELRIDGTLSDEMVQFLATQTVRSAVPRTRGRIDDLVREACGYVSPNNLRVFEAALADQGAMLEEGRFSLDAAATLVPVCLPDEQETRLVGRLPGQGDSFYQYFEADLGVRLTATDELADAAPVNPQVRLDCMTGYGGHRTQSRWALSADETEYASLIAQTEGYLTSSEVDPQDKSRVAFESLVVTRALMAGGIEPAASRKVVAESLISLNVPDTREILARVETALAAGQQEPQIRDLPIMADYCGGEATSSVEALCSAPAAGAAIQLPSRTADVITSLNTPDRAADAATIYASVPVVSVEQVTKSAEVLVTSTDSVPEDATTREVTAAEAREIADLTQFRSDVALFLDVEGNPDQSCRGDSYRNWNTPAFLQEFRAALARSADAKRAIENDVNATLVLVLDGGFFRFDTDSFGAVEWDSVLPGQADASAESLDGMADSLVEKVVHGTVVAGLALGGPDLMDSFGELDMPVTIATRAAYLSRWEAGSVRFYVQDNLPKLVTHGDPDIVNLSIGARDAQIGRLDMLRQSLLGRTGPLFVVAAGNNGNNDSPAGRSIADTGLVPQSWGVGENELSGTGTYNLLVVAALDGDGEAEDLAWFSNYDRQHVYLAAPGCNVKAWTPTTTGEDREYQLATYNGTSFAAPIVTYVAAAVHALLPFDQKIAPWIRARLLSTADINAQLDEEKVRNGRVLNPVAAVRIYEDVLTLTEPLVADGPLELAGRLLDTTDDGDFDKNAFCDSNYDRKHSVLRLFRMISPSAQPRWYVDLMNDDDFMVTSRCTLKSGATVRILVKDAETVVPIERVADIKFAIHRGG